MHKTQRPTTSTKKKKQKQKQKQKKKTKTKNYVLQHSVFLLNVAVGCSWFHNSRCFKP
jgi:endonuclease IV